MSEPLFTLDERLLMALLYQRSHCTVADVVEHFGKGYDGPAAVPSSLTDAKCVAGLFETLWLADVVDLRPGTRWRLTERVREAMALAIVVAGGGVLAVLLENAKEPAEVTRG